MSSVLSALVLPPQYILLAKMDTVTQTDVPNHLTPGLLFTTYVPLKEPNLKQTELRELLIPAFRPYRLLQAALNFVPLVYQWKHDDNANVWDAVAVQGPEEYLRRAQPAVSITATPSPMYLDNVPKAVAVYQALLRPLNDEVTIDNINYLLTKARTDLRDASFPNVMFSVNVQGVEPEPKNDLGRTLGLIVATAAIATTGIWLSKVALSPARYSRK